MKSGEMIMRHHEVILGLAMTAGISLVAADTIRTDAGAVQGITTADGTTRVFKGIPYAAPPVGDLRWKPPQPVGSWSDIRPALEFAPRCAQGHI